MPNTNNTPPAEYNNTENILQMLQNRGFDFYIDKSGKLQSNNSNIITAEQLLNDPEILKKFEGGWFIPDSTMTHWIYIEIKNGRIKKIIPVTSIHALNYTVVNKNGDKFDFLYVEYSTLPDHSDLKTAVIRYSNYSSKRILNDIKGLPYLSKEGEVLKGDLVYYIVSKVLINTYSQNSIEIVPQQGWFINKQRNYRFNPERNYKPDIRNNFPIPIRLRESSCIDKERVKEVSLSQSLIFYNKSSLLLLLLFNLTSLLLTFFIMYGFYPDNVFILKPTEYIDPVLLAAILNNVDYSSFNKLPQIGPQIKELKNKLSWVNDGVILVLDIYTADQYRKAEKGYDMILNNVAGAVEEKNSVYHIIAIISSYADIHIQKEKRCVLEFGDQKTNYTPTQYRNICRQIDDALINKVESDYNSFINIFKRQLIDVSNSIPESIPRSKRITYTMLLTTFRTYNALFEPLFPVELEEKIKKWLDIQEQDQQTVDDVVCADYCSKLNKRIGENYFNYVLKVNHGSTPFNKGKHTIIVDIEERYVYVEPDENFIIVKDDMKSINDTDRLTTSLYNEKYLRFNEHNSKCFRISTIDSNKISHITRMHAISFDIISPENQKRFLLINKESHLFTKEELPTQNFLPLIKVADGRFAGKMIIYDDEENNFYLGTGRNGSGKTWQLVQIMPMIQMMGHQVIVFDVSGSYTRDKILKRKMLPEDVVNHLFKFINVGEDMDNIPVDPFDFSDCKSADAVRINVQYIIRACVGKLKENQEKELNAFLYDYLEKNNIQDFDIFKMCYSLLDRLAALRHTGEKIIPVIEHIRKIGFDNMTWGDLFNDNKIIVVNMGNEVGAKTHQLLDILVGSIFRWQICHDSKFLSIMIDELMDQNLAQNTPINTIICEGRKFHTALFGAKQDFFNIGSSPDDVLKQANMKSFCRPGKSEDRIARMLGFTNAIVAGFPDFISGDTIMDADFFDRELGINTPDRIRGRVVDFVDTPYYDLFKEKYLKPPENYYGNVY